jgi:CRP-like cAMP-binding protein
MMIADDTMIQEAIQELERRGGVVRMKFRPDQTLFDSGNEAAGTYWMRQGQVKLESIDSGGKTHFLHVMTGSRVLGLGAYLFNRPHPYHARALGEVSVIWLDRMNTRKFMEDHPKVMESLMRQLGEELELLENRLRSAYSLDAEERVYETITYLKKCDAARVWTRTEIAEWAGTTPETVARPIGALRIEGRIATEGRRITLLRKKFLN